MKSVESEIFDQVAKGARDAVLTVVLLEIDVLYNSASLNGKLESMGALRALKERVIQKVDGLNAELSGGEKNL